MLPTIKVNSYNATITTIIEYISYKMTQVSEKDYRASNNAMIILSIDERDFTGDDRVRGPPIFLLKLGVGAPSC
jgi:hypothetical protein